MGCRIILSPGARADLRSSVRWYRREDPALAIRFGTDIEGTFRRIAQNYRLFPIVRDVIRRAVLSDFPYAVYCHVNGRTALVRAILHHRRAETHWINRTNGRS